MDFEDNGGSRRHGPERGGETKSFLTTLTDEDLVEGAFVGGGVFIGGGILTGGVTLVEEVLSLEAVEADHTSL